MGNVAHPSIHPPKPDPSTLKRDRDVSNVAALHSNLAKNVAPTPLLSFHLFPDVLALKLGGSNRQPQSRARPTPNLRCEVISGVIFLGVLLKVPNARFPLRTSDVLGTPRSHGVSICSRQGWLIRRPLLESSRRTVSKVGCTWYSRQLLPQLGLEPSSPV